MVSWQRASPMNGNLPRIWQFYSLYQDCTYLLDSMALPKICKNHLFISKKMVSAIDSFLIITSMSSSRRPHGKMP